MVDEMAQFKNLINSTDKKELDKYCDSHEGFYQYMKIWLALLLVVILKKTLDKIHDLSSLILSTFRPVAVEIILISSP